MNAARRSNLSQLRTNSEYIPSSDLDVSTDDEETILVDPTQEQNDAATIEFNQIVDPAQQQNIENDANEETDDEETIEVDPTQEPNVEETGVVRIFFIFTSIILYRINTNILYRKLLPMIGLCLTPKQVNVLPLILQILQTRATFSILCLRLTM